MNKILGVTIILLGAGIALLARPIERNNQEIIIINEKLDKLYAYTKQLDYQISIIEELLRNETNVQ